MKLYLDTSLEHVVSYLLKNFRLVNVPTVFQMVYENEGGKSQIGVYEEPAANDMMVQSLKCEDFNRDRYKWFMSDLAESDAKEIDTRLVLGVFIVSYDPNPEYDKEPSLIVEGKGASGYNSAELKIERYLTEGYRKKIQRRISGEYSLLKTTDRKPNLRFTESLDTYLAFYHFSIDTADTPVIIQKYREEVIP